MMRSGNPALRSSAFAPAARARAAGDVMTIQGTVNKTLILLLLLLLTASFSWSRPDLARPMMLVGFLGGFAVAMVAIFRKTTTPVTGPLYAALEGLAIGAISIIFEQQYPGIVMQAVVLTFGILFALLLVYKSRVIPVTENFRLGVAAATGGVALVYLASFVMGFFGASIPLIHESGPVGIGFSLVVIVIASLNLVMDFDFIERGAEAGAPAYMEWYGAFGLMVTLIWLYLEILRLLAKLNGRR
jgi:uncharacterized YccA/Bax inhibitor family protein